MAAAMCLTSCNKDEQTADGIQFKATMERASSQDAKTILNESDLEWVAGDQVAIYGSEQQGLYTAQPVSGTPTSATLSVVGQPAQGTPYCAIYPASAANSRTSFTIPAEQVTVDGSLTNFPMYAKSADENLAFKNLCGVLKIHLQQTDALVSRIIVTATTEINGNFNINNSQEIPSISYADGGSCTTMLTCTTPQDITEGKDFYVIMPAGDYSGLNVKIMNAGYGVEKNAPEEAVVTIERSKYSTLSFAALDMPVPPDDVEVWGLYSISDNEQVWISSGNLQYNATTETWRFAPEQYTYNSTGWKDLFGWGTSGWDNGNTYYLPTDRAKTSTYSDGYGYGPTNGSSYRLSLTGDYANADWGIYNAIENGGNQPGLWRTLTDAQTNYLNGFNTKRNGRRGTATVNNVHGVVMIPDMWVAPQGLNFVPDVTSWESNVYTADQWSQMEASGAIFLPTAGYYWGETDSRHFAGSEGNYWTATNNGTSGAYYFSSSLNGNGSTSSRVRYYGYSVRLVKDYVPASQAQ